MSKVDHHRAVSLRGSQHRPGSAAEWAFLRRAEAHVWLLLSIEPLHVRIYMLGAYCEWIYNIISPGPLVGLFVRESKKALICGRLGSSKDGSESPLLLLPLVAGCC